MMAAVSGYASVKTLAKQTGRNVPDLLALACQNDPFYAGSAATVDAADWFVRAWQAAGYTTGVHLRRVHYRLVTLATELKPNGLPYENTRNDWSFLCMAAKYARYLGKLNPTDFVDRRNPAPRLMAAHGNSGEPGWHMDEPAWRLPTIETTLSNDLSLSWPKPFVYGYDYSAGEQPFLVEVWAEKSTMDDVLLPVCEELQANLVTSLGFQSITGAVNLVQRVAETGKPARILYISDFDPAGDAMPVAVARQVEYWLQEYAPGADIKLTPLVLTREQVIGYRLPRVPVKDTDRRKANFEERYGEGAVELDALEALHPGDLARLLREAIAPYRDLDLSRRLYDAGEEAQEEIEDAWRYHTESMAQELATIEAEVRQVLGKYDGELQRLHDALETELTPLRERLDGLRRVIRDEQLYDFELPERPEAEIDDADEDGWLFDSGRDYLAQLAAYKQRKQAL